MSLTNQAAAAREVMTRITQPRSTRSTAMNLMHQDLARAQLAWRRQEARHARSTRAVVDHLRWERRLAKAASHAQRAARRAHVALASQ
jgi:hypothetical protein